MSYPTIFDGKRQPKTENAEPGQYAGISLLLVGITAICSLVAGCDSHVVEPTREEFEKKVGYRLPPDAQVIGGMSRADASASETSATSYWLAVISSELPLPLPGADKRRRSPETVSQQRRRFAGRDDGLTSTSIPVTAILNLLAACEVDPTHVPRISSDRGVSHHWSHGSNQIHFRETQSENAWLTVVEVVSDLETADSVVPFALFVSLHPTIAFQPTVIGVQL